MSEKMAMDLLQSKRKTIQRGAYWFGIIGRLSLAFGILSFLIIMLSVGGLIIAQQSGASTTTEMLNQLSAMGGFSSPISAMIYGWLFLLGRDAFSAIDLLIAEMNDVV